MKTVTLFCKSLAVLVWWLQCFVFKLNSNLVYRKRNSSVLFCSLTGCSDGSGTLWNGQDQKSLPYLLWWNWCHWRLVLACTCFLSMNVIHRDIWWCIGCKCLFSLLHPMVQTLGCSFTLSTRSHALSKICKSKGPEKQSLLFSSIGLGFCGKQDQILWYLQLHILFKVVNALCVCFTVNPISSLGLIFW